MKFIIISLLLHGLVVGLFFIDGSEEAGLKSSPIFIDIVETYPEPKKVKSSKVSRFLKQNKNKERARVANKKSVKNLESSVVKSLESTTEKADATSSSAQDQVISSSQAQKIALNYSQQLNLFLVKNKKYPAVALKLRQSGVVKLKVLITPQGEFKNIEIKASSQFKLLDSAAKSLLVRLGGFKPLPAGYKGNGEFIIPIAYLLKESRNL